MAGYGQIFCNFKTQKCTQYSSNQIWHIVISCRMRESAEVTLQRAVTKTKQLTEENHKEILTMIEKAVALRVKNSEVTAGQR